MPAVDWMGARVRWNHPGYQGAPLFGTVIDCVPGTYLCVHWDHVDRTLSPTHPWHLTFMGVIVRMGGVG